MLLMDKSSVLTTHVDIDSNTVGFGEDLYLSISFLDFVVPSIPHLVCFIGH